jgi:metal-sulfur cluster biosynthetic enzyme
VAVPTKDEILKALKECYDPEIPVNIVDLGLIYKLDVATDGKVDLEMTLTAVGCPVSGWMQEQVTEKVRSVPGVTEAKVAIVFEPPWSTAKLTPDGKDVLQAMGFPV